MREQLNRILRTDKVELPHGDPTPLLQMLSVLAGESARSVSPQMYGADLAALFARAARHVFEMLSTQAQTPEQVELKGRILLNIDLIFSRHIPGISSRFEQDRRERLLVKALSEVADEYRSLPRNWLPCDSVEVDWYELARENIREVLRLGHLISSNSYAPILVDVHQLLREYTAVCNVA